MAANKKQEIERYKHLIGMCIDTLDGYFKITDISAVYDEDITVMGLGVCAENSYLPLRLNSYTFVTEAYVKEHKIAEEAFLREFDKAVEKIKKNMGI